MKLTYQSMNLASEEIQILDFKGQDTNMMNSH